VLAVVALPASADELTVSAIVKTIRFHPTGEPARVGFKVLSRRGLPGWKALASLTVQLLEPHREVAHAAARALAEGPEPQRLVLAAQTYKRLDDPAIRAILAVGLAYGYEDHRMLLLKHLRENRRGAPAVLEVLAPKILPEPELRGCLKTPDLAPIAYAALRARELTVQARELLPWARSIAKRALDPDYCRRWAQRRDFLIFQAVALALDTADDDQRDGAHCLLLTLSGRKLPADADIWRSWIAAHQDRFHDPPELSPGLVAAAVLRGARFLRHDLLADGKCVWSADVNGPSAIGATGLAVMALRSSGYPATHPAIERALRSTLLVFGPGDAPALPGLDNRARETYILACLTLALCEVDAKKYRVPLDALRRRLVLGMQRHGQWSYQCLTPTDSMRAGRTDNSITQYAVLALRSLAKAGFEIKPETWQAIAMHLYRSVNKAGGWYYRPDHGGPAVSMTSAGISSLAICHEALGKRDAAKRIQADAVLTRARAYLGRLLMEGDYAGVEPYAFYGVERALVLTATKEFRSKHRTYDWYRRGARRLLATQHRAGHWGYPERRAIVGHSYGRAIDSAYAILFLTKATATIGSGGAATLKVELPPEKDKPEPPPPPPPPRVEPPPQPPDVEPELAVVPTRSGEAVIRGHTTGVSLTIDGRPVRVDARGRFAIPVAVSGPQTFVLSARGENGLLATRRVAVAFDTDLPRVERMGPPQRHVGKQVIVFRAHEALRSLQVAGRVYPADGPLVRAAIEVGEGKRALTVIATDRAGNESREKIEIDAVNRVLVLDCQSAVGVDLRERPARFTLECWVRGDAPARPAAIVANTEGSGFGLFWRTKKHARPSALARVGGKYLTVVSKGAWNWSAWTHLALSYDGQKLRYFVNGILQGEDAGGPHAQSGHRLFVGAEPNRHSAPREFFTGAVDEVRVSKVARYVADFRPKKNFMRDKATLLLLHFDRETVADRVLLDDSGMHHHASPHGTPVQLAERRQATAPASVLVYGREELRQELPPLELPELTPLQHVMQNARAKEASRSLHLLPVAVSVTSAQGVPLSGIAVRALHETFDISAGPAVTDARGEAVLPLPRGPWRIDLVTHEPQAGRMVFARLRRPVRAEGKEEITIDRRRQVRFRSRLGEVRAAHVVTLAWPDLTFFRRVDVRQGQFDILTVDDAPMVVQAVRHPGEEGDGYVFRRTVGPGTTIVETDPEQGTLHTFSGKGVRALAVRYGSADALPIPLAFESKETRRVLLAGLSECVVGYDVDLGGRGYGFYPRPFQLDGKPRTFLGKPPFRASVGYVHNGRPRYRTRHNTGNIRIFLQTVNGMMLKFDPRSVYTVAWEQVLHGQVRASGPIKPPQRVRTPAVDPKEIGNLRYRLRINGPGENRRVEVAAHGQSSVVQVGKVRTWCFPEVEPNARMWVACVNRAVRAYEDTCPNRRPRTDIERSIEMPPGLAGMGGWMGSGAGWMWLPEGSVYGFVGQWYWTGLLCHELGHVHGYGHGNPTQSRIMRQAGRRAGRRLWALRPGMARAPEGNRFLPLLEAVTRGDLQVQQGFDDARDIPVLRKTGEGHTVGDGILVPNLEITGDDAVFMWYYRAVYGEEVDAVRRRHAASWSWWLTRKGFSDPEIQIALFSHAAQTSLAWLARLRGNMVYDHRIDAALEELKANEGKFVYRKERDAILHRWRTKRYAPSDDLAQQATLMREEVGHRWARFEVLKTLAREHFVRREMAEGEQMLVAALVEARLGGEGMLESALQASAVLWVAR
jgi:hypothetical protein